MTALRYRTASFLLLASMLAAACAPSSSPVPAAPLAADSAAPAPPTAPLGRVHFAVSCSPAAQRDFDHAVVLLHHMTYPGARQAFERVAAADSSCAMAHWGVAMTLFQPLWPTRPSPDALRRGWTEVERARALAPATERERMLIAATAAFYQSPDSGVYWDRIRRWEQAMAAAHDAFPDDTEITALYALAHLAAAPPEAKRAHSDRAAALLLAVHAKNPDHPGVVHYLIHANDENGREHESLEIVRGYDAIAPRNPHALHMPTHIYTRLGDWDGVIAGNLAAAAAALEHPAGEAGESVWDEFPHAIEYLVYAHLQRGDDAAAAAELNRMERTERLQPSFKTAFHLASTRARYALERHDWAAASALAPRSPATLSWDRFPWPEAVTWFAKGYGAARQDQPEAAHAAVLRLDALEAAAREAGEELFARNIRLLRLETESWLAHEAGMRDSSVALMSAAVKLEAATPKHAVTPAPTLPALELLGDVLSEQQRPAEALEAYQRSLELYPRRFNSLLGAARAARDAGDQALARRLAGELLALAAEGSDRPELDEARDILRD